MLLVIAADPQVRIRDIAATVGITERAAQSIVTDLLAAGYVERIRQGRRNRYAIVAGRHLRHPSQRTVPVQALIDLFTGSDLLASVPVPSEQPRSEAELLESGPAQE
ncbi:helix-turn-helix transcriptional regulator [Nonomuraea sp. 10N515B]|uniref:helix-turn-helix transcriptional regulator n=1 Tax=Nonomuraea sp. 10N515B TaxID=3457422 RepID=UPI003FCE3D8E